MAEPKEPQSYGSQGDWLSGNTGQEVNRQKGNSNSQHADFYSSHRESEENAPDQGGRVSPEQMAENDQASGRSGEEETPVQKVTALEGGAKTDSYFKRRDYD